MTAFAQQSQAGAAAEFENGLAPQPKRPARWSASNWPVRWKVFAIVLVPLLLAGAFGGLRLYTDWVEAGELQRAAQRAELVPATNEYMASLEGALLANSTGGDPQAALATFDASKQNLRRHLAEIDVSPDVAQGVESLLAGGQELLDKVTANSIGLRDRITAYAPLLLTAEDVITGSVRVEDQQIRAEALGLSRAMGSRGQMMMQQLLVNLGAEVPEPELRTSLITLAGTEPSTLFGISQVVGIKSEEAQTLQSEFVKRMGLISNPTVPLVNNPELSQSLQTTNGIALQVIDTTKAAVASAVDERASEQRVAAIRDSVVVGVALLVALLIVTLVAGTIVRPLRRLRDGALKVAHEDLARELERVRAGGAVGVVQPLPVQTTEEIGQVAHAVDELHEQAVLLAGEQANLQLQVDDMFETLSRRSRSLVDQQLALIDGLERDEQDPQRLESLFKLDHLAARMRRNGANLLVLAGSKVPREQAEAVPVAAIVNAAASEVEDYARIITASVPDTEVHGSAAGDVVHLLAELLDNALRYSPPISQVRVSAVHANNGGLVIEISDAGLGMTEADLRVANTRLQSGGEVNPYTARHMGLFVVGRLAAQHGLVVRLRSTVAGEPNSGITAGVFLPAELLVEQAPPPAEPRPAPAATAWSMEDEGASSGYGGYTDYAGYGNNGTYGTNGAYGTNGYNGYHAEPEYQAESFSEPDPEQPVNGRPDEHADIPISLLPQRNPGASGISGIPVPPPTSPPVAEPVAHWADEDEWPADSMPAQTPPPDQPPAPPVRAPQPTNTAAFFASRQQAAAASGPSPAQNGVHQPPRAPEPVVAPEPQSVPEPAPAARETAAAAAAAADDSDGSIFSKMLSEWLIDDPHELASSTDLDWQTVWDKGWSAAAAAAEVPVEQHTEHGLPMRQPGARLVPGAAQDDDGLDLTTARRRNGGDEGFDGLDESAPDSLGFTHRDPNVVRSTISSHFGGVHAGRTHARQSRETNGE